MRKLGILGAALAATLVIAMPVAAEPPEMNVSVYEEVLPPIGPVDNPCTAEIDEIVFTSTTTNREILFPDGRRVTAVSYEIHSPDPWTGTGTDTGVEQPQGDTVSHRWLVTNSDTGQKFKFTIRGHYNANTDTWTGGVEARCVTL